MFNVNKDIGFVPLRGTDNVFLEKGIEVTRGRKFRKLPGKENTKDVVTFKYTEYRYLIQCIESGYLFFARNRKWEDPFDKKYYRDEIVINGTPYHVFCLCITNHDVANEDSLWKVYEGTHNHESQSEIENRFVRITYNMKTLYEELGRIGDYKFYLAHVNYVERNQFFNENECTYDNLDSYLLKLCKKRIAFEYENEYRLFAVHEGAYNDNENKENGIKIHMNYKNVIDNVTLPPLKPHTSSYERYIRNEMYKGIKEQGLKCNISTLYEGDQCDNTRNYKKYKL